MNLLVAHGGGPTAVINSSLQGVIERARELDRHGKIYAARFGLEGILRNDLADLTDVPASAVNRLRGTPSSAIGSCRRRLEKADLPALLECLQQHQIDCFLYNGGNDSMDTCEKIAHYAAQAKISLKIIGIPKTMDNDLAITDHCPGYGSAARYAALTAAEMAAEASALPIHVVILELMGRNAGWVTAASTLAAGRAACEILAYLPERPVNEKRMLLEIERAFAKGRGLLVAVSEGLRRPDGTLLADTGIRDGFGHIMPGGTGQYLASRVLEQLGLKARAEKPGLAGRCSMGCISAADQEEAYTVGAYAVEAALQGETGGMVAIAAHRHPTYRYRMFLTPFHTVANQEKLFPLEWIEEHGHISAEFFDYVAPLLGGALPKYVRFF
ncbi:MAG: diphosphate--fructose-6-phosphate 1-phosphotransferase [Oscillospiraceae bacterium]|jgi:6-phosphofructokinase|nr:diphosphate--fructose-6-phosphate 1-phosphotransferase [Oscillospiraceae bacterium]